LFLEYIGCGDDTLGICPANSAGPEQPAFGPEVFLVAGNHDLIMESCLNRHAHQRWFWPQVKKGRLTLENGALETVDTLAVKRGISRKFATHYLDTCFACVETPDRPHELTFGSSQSTEIPLGAMRLSIASNYMETAGYYLSRMLSTPECPVDHANWHPFVTMNEQTGKAELDRVDVMCQNLRVAMSTHRRKPLVNARIEVYLRDHPELKIG
jgi:hypothetical protein